MTRRPNTRLACAALCASLLVSSCAAGITEAPAGPYKAFGTSVSLESTWADITGINALFSPGTPRAKVLSMDGPFLNRLYLVELKPGEPMVRAASRERPTPVFRADMSENEQVEMVAESVTALGYSRVETRDLRPQTVSGVEGLRFDFDAQTKEGLNIDGTALAARTRDRLHLIVFFAPEEHYFPALRDRVETILASAKLN
jgi:hypothetical protein